MPYFATYDTFGKIKGVGQIADADDVALQALPGDVAAPIDHIPADWQRGWYGLDLVLTRRPPLPVTASKTTISADDADEAVLTGFPAGAIVSIDGSDHAIEGGSLIITSPMPATYHLTCRHWPYLDWEVGIEAVAP